MERRRSTFALVKAINLWLDISRFTSRLCQLTPVPLNPLRSPWLGRHSHHCPNASTKWNFPLLHVCTYWSLLGTSSSATDVEDKGGDIRQDCTSLT